jgi:hypothetical protein
MDFMKNSKTMRKALTLALAVMLVFALSVPAFATDYFTTTNASYLQGSEGSYATSTTIYVNLVVESRQISGNNLYRTVSNIALNPGGTPKTFDVRDALLAVQGTNGLTFNDSSGNPIDSSDDYVYSITDTDPNPDRTYAPTSPTAWNGWMFRIDGQFPLLSAGWGSSISTAYLTNGDTIHFYHEDMDDGGSGAYYAKITSVSNDGDYLTANVKASSTYYEDDYDWVINNFTNYQGVTVQVLDANGNFITSGATNASGNVVNLDISSLGTPTCKVKVVRRFLSTGDYQNGLIQNTEDLVVYTPQ